eukprot:530871-Pyramimonas_sp.AAC.1
MTAIPRRVELGTARIGQDTREDTGPFRGPHCRRNARRHVSRGARHRGALELAGSTSQSGPTVLVDPPPRQTQW